MIAFLFILQPDFGMTFLLTLTWLTQLFIFGLSMIFIVFAGFLSVLAVIYAYKSLPHVVSRIDKFINIDIKIIKLKELWMLMLMVVFWNRNWQWFC